MFGLGTQELLIILVIAFFVFGGKNRFALVFRADPNENP